MRRALLAVLFIACIGAIIVLTFFGPWALFDPTNHTNDTPTNGDPRQLYLNATILEEAISRRTSIWEQQHTLVPLDMLEDVLWSAYGRTTTGRTVESLCGEYPLVIYASQAPDSYLYNHITGSLEMWSTGPVQGVPTTWMSSPCWLIVAVDHDQCTNIYHAYKEAGGVVQNVYLAANTLGLGTVCMGGSFDQTLVESSLGLPSNHEVILVMPLGYPGGPYEQYHHLILQERPASTSLPKIQNSSVSLQDALAFHPSQSWNRSLTSQELSQVLWAGYGRSYYYDNERDIVHRTVPSAHAVYPGTIYVANVSALYTYDPTLHALIRMSTNDTRAAIAAASGASWLAEAPLLLVIVWQERPDEDYGFKYGNIEVGLIAENIFLESHAWDLHADWDLVDDEEALRNLFVLFDPTIHPAMVIGLGANH